MKIYLVGGAVRDKLLGHPIKERDYVVVGATEAEMREKGYRQVGKEFPVFLHPETKEEYALARQERKVKPGYTGFTFDSSPTVTLAQDLLRRDLTINAMAEDLGNRDHDTVDTLTGALIDPYHGQADLKAKCLRHVSPAFREDPVRILRIGRFAARYADFQIAEETLQLMREMVHEGEIDALVPERVWKELERALAEKDPTLFFKALADCGAFPTLFPELTNHGPAPGIKALHAATSFSTLSVVRFAVLLHVLPKQPIAALCHRYRVPNAYRELALLTASHYQEALQASEQSAEALLKLFNALDIYRREKRFLHFVSTCQAIADAHSKIFSADWLKKAALVAKSVDVQALLTKGLPGNILADTIKKKRLEKLTAWLQA